MNNCVGNYGVLIMAAVADISFSWCRLQPNTRRTTEWKTRGGYSQNTKSGLAD